MFLPDFDNRGDLPEGVHRAALAEVLARFGRGTTARQAATASLLRIHDIAKGTGKLQRFVIFGSYVTAKAEPNDVDVVLVMDDDFRFEECRDETRDLFIHDQATAKFGGSVFWVRPAAILTGTLEGFIAHWQVKRDKSRRGIVEVTV
jgi:hypothetical protein